MTTFFIVLPNS